MNAIRIYLQRMNPPDEIVYHTHGLGVACLVFFGAFATAVCAVIAWLIL